MKSSSFEERKAKNERYISWSQKQVRIFWDYFQSNSTLQDVSFSEENGVDLMDFAKCIYDLENKRILDFGCGTGGLIEHLLSTGSLVYGADSSTTSIENCNRRFTDRENWRGAVRFRNGKLPFRNESFDLIFCIEVIEHLTSECLREVLSGLFRLIGSRGRVVFTTPYMEDLNASMVICPNCEALFHRWQHVRSWSVSALGDRLKDAGFEIDFCGPIDFGRFRPSIWPNWRDISLRIVKESIRNYWFQGVDRVKNSKFPNTMTFRDKLRYPPKNVVAVVRGGGVR